MSGVCPWCGHGEIHVAGTAGKGRGDILSCSKCYYRWHADGPMAILDAYFRAEKAKDRFVTDPAERERLMRDSEEA